jgi:RNA polymerase sigma factor (sigma-70 family)
MPVAVRAKPQPFSSFFREQAPAVGRLLTALVPHEQVEELVQETFIAALRGYDDFDGASPRGWVLAIARRKAIDEHRSRGRRPLQSELDAEAHAADPGPDPGAGEIWGEVATLPPKQRAALVLRFALDMPHREIGEALGCSEAAARRSVHEGIATLRSTRGAKLPAPAQEARR